MTTGRTDLGWLAFMQKLADADSTKVTILDDGSGDYAIDGVEYHCIPPTPTEQQALPGPHAELLLRASRVANLAALRQTVDGAGRS